MSPKRRRRRSSFFREHSLSLIVAAVWLGLLFSYLRSDPSTHIGALVGNAVADWLGMLVFIIATKYFFETKSRESRQPHPRVHERVARFLVEHSLSIVLLVTGAIWVAIYVHSDAQSKSGTVIGNIVSEWTQILGLVLMTKYAREAGSKEG
ncbi:MAG TPA: hypothetical protein VKB34_02990 [Povalibacter sp.]|nr:hypothetical protein [Povalibacter sp.]